MKFFSISCLAFFFAILTCAQDRDYLTPNEIEQVRQAQDPNERLALYVHFAKERMDLIEQYLAKDKPGRSIFVHNTLEDYSRIIEAIDSVSDDALRHNRPIDKAMMVVLSAEKDFLARLNKIQDSDPKDLDRYKFVLTDAIDTTSDSHDLSLEDSKKRGADLSAEDAKEKKERETVMSSEEKAERKKAGEKEEEPKKKIPSLYRPGEKPQTPQQ